MTGRSRTAAWLALFTTVLCGLAGCASIPNESEPKVVKQVDGATSGNDSTPSVPEGLNPLALVRNFINAAANPSNDYAAARLHLTDSAAQAWQVPAEMLIVDNVDTVPMPRSPDTPENVRRVSLRVSKVGKLLADHSFVPASGTYETVFRLKMQEGGEWRIANPPPDLIVSRSSFAEVFLPVSVYFLDHERDGVVPDRRYVVGRPASTLPARVMELLLSGPSRGFRGAMHSALPPGATTATNVSEAGDGALVVNFSDLGEMTERTKRLIAAQVVLSLQEVSNARVRLLEEGTSLLPGTPVLRPADVASFKTNNNVPVGVAPLAVVDESLVVLNSDAPPVPGPAGSGAYQVTTAARSADGSRLAAVTRMPGGGVELRVGRYGAWLNPLPVRGSFMTRPTWRTESEVWTVVDGRKVVRAVRGQDGNWSVTKVDARRFVGKSTIDALRISRDGTRVAGVVDGEIVVAGIVSEDGNVVLRKPRVLGDPGNGPKVTGVEWLRSDSLVAITGSRSLPVFEVTVDGFSRTPFDSANLLQPITAVTVGPGHKVVVADPNGLWRSTDQDDLWQLLQVPIGGGSIPFYPG